MRRLLVGLFTLVFSVLAALTAAPEAYAQERYAAFVADMDTGEVLHARRADASRYPASLTKMMTLYMLFEAIERGELSLNSEIVFSAEAASRPATRLGLAGGESIRAEDAIRALIIQSSNDVAVAVAEHLAGSESAFAEAMTERARALGLTGTVFRNASGLPDPGQRTTARDMARLAYALQTHFPGYFSYFSETRFTWRGATHRTHNTLVGSVDGVNGLKTGYIRASGFNVAVTSDRDGRRLVAVVMGGASPAVRDAHARELVEAAYASLSAREEGRLLASLQTPRINPIREQEILTAELAAAPQQTAMGSAPGAPPVRVELADEADLEAISAPAETGLPGLPHGWAIQVGAYGSQAAALARLESVAMMGVHEFVASARPVAEPLERGGSRLWRARYSGLDADAARAACARLEARGEPCFAVSPQDA